MPASKVCRADQLPGERLVEFDGLGQANPLFAITSEAGILVVSEKWEAKRQ